MLTVVFDVFLVVVVLGVLCSLLAYAASGKMHFFQWWMLGEAVSACFQVLGALLSALLSGGDN